MKVHQQRAQYFILISFTALRKGVWILIRTWMHSSASSPNLPLENKHAMKSRTIQYFFLWFKCLLSCWTHSVCVCVCLLHTFIMYSSSVRLSTSLCLPCPAFSTLPAGGSARLFDQYLCCAAIESPILRCPVEVGPTMHASSHWWPLRSFAWFCFYILGQQKWGCWSTLN